MKTLKIMSIIGLVFFGVSLIANPFTVAYPNLGHFWLPNILYGLALCIVALMQSNKPTGPS